MAATAAWYHVHHAPVASNGAADLLETAPFVPVVAPSVEDARDQHRPLVALAALIAVMFAWHTWWVWANRRGSLLLIDETGFASTSIENGLWHTFRTQQVQGPLAPIVGIPFQLLLGRSTIAAWTTIIAFGAGATAAVFALARAVTSRTWAVLAAVVVATSPTYIDLSRIAYVMVPSAALLLATAVALVHSHGLRRTGWSVGAGVLGGLTVLCRPMVVAFLPGVFLAPAAFLLAQPDNRGRRVRNLLLGIAAGVLVAETWLYGNLDRLLDYLVQGRDATNGGLGAGGGRTPAARAIREMSFAAGLPLIIVLGLLISLGLVSLWRTRRREPDGAVVASRRRDAELMMLAAALWGGAVIVLAPPSIGTWLYVLPFLVVLAVAGGARLQRERARQAATVALLALSLLTIVSKSGVWPWLTERRSVDIPTIGAVSVVDGRSFDQRNLARLIGEQTPGRGLGARGKAWNEFAETVTSDLIAYTARDGRVPVVLLSRPAPDLMFHPWSLRLADRLHHRTGLIVGQLVYGGLPYEEQLVRPEYGFPNFLLVYPPFNTGGPYPAVSRPAQAAIREGFRPVRQYTMPDGRPLVAWFKEDRGPSLLDRPNPF
jgi:hypothetical protein